MPVFFENSRGTCKLLKLGTFSPPDLTLAEQAATKFDAFGWIFGRFLDRSNVMALEMAQNGHILADF